MDLTKREKIGLTVFVVITIFIVSIVYFNKSKSDTVEVINKNNTDTINSKAINNSNKKNGDIQVYISGEIKKPGVYTLKDGDRAEMLIEMAGGFTSEADVSFINLAMKLKDEDFIKIPLKTQAATVAGGNSTVQGSTAQGSSGLININTATKDQLMELPRIGDAISQRIIDYREKIGFFKDIKNIMDVSGIGTKMFENIKDKITVH